MKHSYLLAGIKTQPLISMIIRNGGFSLRYTFRFLFLLNASLWSSVFAAIERKRFKNTFENGKPVLNPVFILGHWRTGTTFLHQLLALDPQFSSPSVYQVSNPDHFLISKKYYQPIMSKALGDKRPMDNVRIGVDEPQEDEYALLKLCQNTPLEKLIFPKGSAFFLSHFTHFNPNNEERFTQALKMLSKKLTINHPGRPLFKNPFHSLRIPILARIFPEASFVHIYRNPVKVVYSSRHMWDIVGKQNALKTGWISPSVVTLANFYKHTVNQVRMQFTKLDNHKTVEVKFEDLEANPVAIIRHIYNKLDIPFTNNYENALNAYLKTLSNYKKNTYLPSNDEQIQIKEILKDTLPEYF